jgi:hypothetical protein
MSKKVTKKDLQAQIDTLQKDINVLVFSPHAMEVSLVKKKYELQRDLENAIMSGDTKPKSALNHFGVITIY